MKRVVTVAAVVAVMLGGVVPIGIWLLVRDQPRQLPEISAYSHGHLIRVGPYFYCQLRDLNDCQSPQTTGELRGAPGYPVQLSVPPAIGMPWFVLPVYENGGVRQPSNRLAVTIPSSDSERGRLTGVVVQLYTVLRGPGGEEIPLRYAEWSVRMVWS